MFKTLALALVGTVAASGSKSQLQVQTLNGIIAELDILEKAKLNSGLEVEMLDFLQNEMENGSLSKMEEGNRSRVLGDTVMWMKKRFTNRPY
tara:strand:+ start:95 stop:370 length:276 start_codon:yes stop_codon:yes gene_type:complete